MGKNDIKFDGSDMSTNDEARLDFNKSLRHSGVIEYDSIPPDNADPNLFKFYNDGTSVHLNWTESNGTNHDQILGGLDDAHTLTSPNETVTATSWNSGAPYGASPNVPSAGKYLILVSYQWSVSHNVDHHGLHFRITPTDIPLVLSAESYIWRSNIVTPSNEVGQMTIQSIADLPAGIKLGIDAFKENSSNIFRISNVTWSLIKIG